MLGRAVVVNDPDTTTKGHSDGHVGLGDGVHGRGYEGGFEGDFFGKRRVKVDLVRGEVNIPGQDDEVVVGQAVAVGEELGSGEPVLLDRLEVVHVVFHRSKQTERAPLETRGTVSRREGLQVLTGAVSRTTLGKQPSLQLVAGFNGKQQGPRRQRLPDDYAPK